MIVYPQKGGGSASFTEVDTYNDLPAAVDQPDKIYLVLNATGTWILGTRKKAGLYRSNGSTWDFMGSAVVIDDTASSTEKVYSSQKVSDMVGGLTKSDLDLGNVDNTADVDKPISTAQQDAIDLKEDKSALGTAAYRNVNDLAQRLMKDDSSIPAFELSGSSLVASQNFKVLVGDAVVSFSAGDLVTLPALVSATDYKVYATANGVQAVAWDSAAPADSTEIGGFHVYHTTGTINPHSIWDLKFRPSCSPRGMTRYGKLWVDIYLMDVDYGINGYSRGDVTIADGSSPPKIPTAFGGDGTTTYGSLTWYEAWDLANHAGKRLPFYGEFTGLAYGVVEQQSVGADPATTKYQAGYRSACGVEQVTGVMWQWGADIQGNTGGGWADITDGRGQAYQSGISGVILGANWGDGAHAGSRASRWNVSPSYSSYSFGARAACDHLILD